MGCRRAPFFYAIGRPKHSAKPVGFSPSEPQRFVELEARVRSQAASLATELLFILSVEVFDHGGDLDSTWIAKPEGHAEGQYTS